MVIHSLSVSYFRRFHQSLKCELHPQLTILDGASQSGKKSLLQAVAILTRHSAFTNRDFCLTDGKPVKPCHLCVEVKEPQAVIPSQHLPGMDWQQDYLLNQKGHLEVVSQFRNGHTLHEVRCLRVHHPDHPELSDLLQLNNAQLRRRLTLSAVPTREVDRRSNRAIRQALRAQHPQLSLKETLLPLHSGDALHLQRTIDKALPHCVFRRITSVNRDPAYIFKEVEREFQRREADNPADQNIPRRRLLLLSLPRQDGVEGMLRKGAFCRDLSQWIKAETCQTLLVGPHSVLKEHFTLEHLRELGLDDEGRPILETLH